jgi:hypothetical protein
MASLWSLMGEPPTPDQLNPIAHTSDPPTSHLAATAMQSSGKRAAHKNLVLSLCRRFPGSTAIELWKACSAAEKAELKEPQEVRRRLTDLLHDVAVRQVGMRSCRVRGTKMVTWEAVATVAEKGAV